MPIIIYDILYSVPELEFSCVVLTNHRLEEQISSQESSSMAAESSHEHGCLIGEMSIAQAPFATTGRPGPDSSLSRGVEANASDSTQIADLTLEIEILIEL